MLVILCFYPPFVWRSLYCRYAVYGTCTSIFSCVHYFYMHSHAQTVSFQSIFLNPLTEWQINYRKIALLKNLSTQPALRSNLPAIVTIWQFQNAKLEFESQLIKASESGDIKYSIVRPTAFFKSVSGKLYVASLPSLISISLFQ